MSREGFSAPLDHAGHAGLYPQPRFHVGDDWQSRLGDGQFHSLGISALEKNVFAILRAKKSWTQDVRFASRPPNHKAIEHKDIPNTARNAMSEVENAFEMGDGYYDLLSEKIYAVYGDAEMKQLIGYVVEGLYRYSEDDENVDTTDYYYTNGIRFDSSVWQ